MIQVSRLGAHFTILCDGVVCGQYLTKGAATNAALILRELQDPIKLNH